MLKTVPPLFYLLFQIFVLSWTSWRVKSASCAKHWWILGVLREGQPRLTRIISIVRI